MAAVSDSSPLILYSRINRLDLIHAVFGEILVPPAVWHEVVFAGIGKPGAWEVERTSWIHKHPRPEPWVLESIPDLDPGETEAIALAASQVPPLAVLLDDAPARRRALELGLTTVGSGGLLVLAKSQGHVSSVGPHLKALKYAGLFLGAAAESRILARAGEH